MKKTNAVKAKSPVRKATASKASQKPPAKQLADLMAKYDPAIVKLASKALARLRKLMPGAIETVYKYSHSLVIGFGATEKGYEAAIVLALYTDHILLYFNWGKKLKDPNKILRGNAKQVRYIPFPDIGTLDEPAVQDLLRQAMANSAQPFGAKRKMIIKSSSANQKPKRTAK
jgi:hypothetical protein